MLCKLEQERNLLVKRQTLPIKHGAFNFTNYEDIIEYWHDNQLDDWRGNFSLVKFNMSH